MQFLECCFQKKVLSFRWRPGKRRELRELLAMLDLIPIDGQVLERAQNPFPVNVRALDAIHVATAEVIAFEAKVGTLEFWTHDNRQATAALCRGLTVRGV